MSTRSTYRPPRRASGRTARTRARIVSAVRELLSEGAFHECTMEEVAERAGVSRATLYQHFPSRFELIDATCDTMGVNPALLELRDAVGLEDAEEALNRTLALTVRFWASEDAVLAQLYGVSAVDPAAKGFVERQEADRRGEFARLVKNLERARRLRKGLGRKRALGQLLVLTA